MIFHSIKDASGQTPMTLNEAMRITLENNQQIRTSRLNIEKEESITGKAFSIPRPKLFTEFEGVKGSLSEAESRKIGISQELEFPTNYFLRSDVQSSQILIAKEELNERSNLLKAEVKRKYSELLYKNKELDNAREIAVIYSDFTKIAAKKYEVGETSNLEVLGAKVNRIKYENQVSNIESEIRSLRTELRTLMNVTYDITPSDEFDFQPYNVSMSELFNKAVDNNPSMKVMKHKKEKFSNQLSLSRGELLPDISLSYYRQKLAGDNGYWGMELGLGIPLWFWGEESGKIKESGYDLKIASSEELSLRNTLTNDLTRAVEEYENSMRQMKFLGDEALKEAEEIFRQAKISYAEGAIGYVEYLQALTIVHDVRTQYLNSIYNYRSSVITIEEITGGELK